MELNFVYKKKEVISAYFFNFKINQEWAVKMRDKIE